MKKSANYYVYRENKGLDKKKLITIYIGKRRVLETNYDYYVYREKKDLVKKC